MVEAQRPHLKETLGGPLGEAWLEKHVPIWLAVLDSGKGHIFVIVERDPCFL